MSRTSSMRPVYIDEDEKKIREEVEGALHNFLKFNASPLSQKPSLPPKEELEAKGYGFTRAAPWRA